MTDVSAGTAAPAAPEAPVATATPAPGSTVDQAVDAANGGAEPAKTPRTFTEEEFQKALQKRLGTESRRQRRSLSAEIEARVRAEYAERALQEARGGTKPQQGQAGTNAEPKEADFPSYEAWLSAHIRWQVKQEREQDAARETEKRSQTESQTRMAEQARSVHDQLFTPGTKKYEDFEEVVMEGDYPITEPMAATLLDSKFGHDIWYHLASNPQEAKRIAGLTPAAQVRAILALETKYSAPPAPTKAPAPIAPVGSGSGVSKEWKDMSTAEHIRAYHDRKRKR